jgi:hypothetical protein
MSLWMLRTAEEFALRRAVDACDRAIEKVNIQVQVSFYHHGAIG